ncbi:inner ear-specific collagen-like [Solea senegalensis]|nr:otolin-1-A-like [Solea senegalensis]KAG7479072.1 inner ear-specific collagen-like [Solea senegalensis]
MLTFPLYLLLMVVSLPIIVVMPQTIPLNNTYSPGENMTQEEHCHELLYSPDPVPMDELPWYCLCMQCQDSKGPKGDRGDLGLPGMPGTAGRRGVKGYRGIQGFMGTPGMKGQKGNDGERGQPGLCGMVGFQGSKGFKGETGGQGLKGYPGDQGPKGDDGVCPENCEPIVGPPGDPGLTGPAGPRGLPGPTGLRGPKGYMGEKGDLGQFGAPGHAGEKGELGPLGECNCIDGIDGFPGPKGPMGDKGVQGQEGPAGQMGLKGDEGDQGPTGIMGLPGLCKPMIQSAFSAWLTSSFPFPTAPVAFSSVFYNIQMHYNTTTGVYTAPTAGTYVFKYHLAIHERILKVGLFLNSIAVVKTTDNKLLGTSSHSVILHLEQGDRVWVQVKDLHTNGMYAGPEIKSTFSGFLLYQDECTFEVSPYG